MPRSFSIDSDSIIMQYQLFWWVLKRRDYFDFFFDILIFATLLFETTKSALWKVPKEVFAQFKLECLLW
jgi:hypothetical protein